MDRLLTELRACILQDWNVIAGQLALMVTWAIIYYKFLEAKSVGAITAILCCLAAGLSKQRYCYCLVVSLRDNMAYF